MALTMQVSEAQLEMLSNIFPRHVLNFLTENNAPELLGRIAKAHNEVTIMFMDVVGEQGHWFCLWQKVEHSPAHMMLILAQNKCPSTTGFTSMAKEVSPVEVMDLLNE